MPISDSCRLAILCNAFRRYFHEKILLALLLSAFLLSGCGAGDSGNFLSVKTNQPDGSTSNPEQMEDAKQAEKEDVSGIYTDKQGTSDAYSQLTLALQADGTYAVEISVYRTTQLEGTAVWEGDTLRFTSEDPYVLADISVTGSKAEVMVITDAAGVLAGDVYSFPDGAPGKNSEQTEEDSSQQSLSRESPWRFPMPRSGKRSGERNRENAGGSCHADGDE